jgi:hypothetical protein
MCKGYYALRIAKDTKDYTTIATPRDKWRFSLMPFGVMCAGATYSRLLRTISHRATSFENVVDDVIAYYVNCREHLKTLRDFFERVHQANIKIIPSTSKIGYPKVEFWGHLVS